MLLQQRKSSYEKARPLCAPSIDTLSAAWWATGESKGQKKDNDKNSKEEV